MKLLACEPPDADPHVRWCGRGARRRAPLPDPVAAELILTAKKRRSLGHRGPSDQPNSSLHLRSVRLFAMLASLLLPTLAWADADFGLLSPEWNGLSALLSIAGDFDVKLSAEIPV